MSAVNLGKDEMVAVFKRKGFRLPVPTSQADEYRIDDTLSM